MQASTEFRLNSKVLFDKIEAIKKNPPAEIMEFKAARPEFKTVNCALIAEYIGLSEKTLTNLKLGKLTDSNCSTIWLICTTLGIDPREYLGLPKQSECNPETCTSHAQARLDEKRQRIAQMEAAAANQERELAKLRTIIKEQSIEYGGAKARAEVLERLISEKDGSIARRDKGIQQRNRIIVGMIILFLCILVVDLLLAKFGWFRFGPIK